MERPFFNEQSSGYDKEQVDNYIRKIAEAYQAVYSEYSVILEKYTALEQEHQKLKSEKQNGIDADIIAKTLINSEKLAREIVDKAHDEESRIIDLTVKNLQYAYHTLENAMSEVQKFLLFNNSGPEEEPQ